MDRKIIWRQANALKSKGKAAQDKRDWYHAHDAYEAALDLYTQIGVKSLQARVLGALGFIALKRGVLDDAAAYFKRALVLSLAAPHLKSGLLNGLARLYIQQGHREEACALIPQMWASLEKQRNRASYIWGFSYIGHFAEEIEAYELANESYMRALHYDSLLNNGRQRSQNHMLLYYMGRVARKQGAYIISWEFHAEALHLAERNRISTMRPHILQSWALLEHREGHLQEAHHLICLAYIENERVMEETIYDERTHNEILEHYLAITGTLPNIQTSLDVTTNSEFDTL